eukprot:scaffold102228_cov21-Phaeocystis_antarctica.AAC.1
MAPCTATTSHSSHSPSHSPSSHSPSQHATSMRVPPPPAAAASAASAAAAAAAAAFPPRAVGRPAFAFTLGGTTPLTPARGCVFSPPPTRGE